jgi:hypothetical protein
MRAVSAGVLLLLSLIATPCAAEAWVAKMFAEKSHNFGTVARGSDTVFRFAAKNIYKQDVELVSVRSSCGCTTPSVEKKVLKTGDVGYVTAKFNTRTFTGIHGATLTVEVRWNDKGTIRRGETQLRVDGNIRGDVVFTPGAVKFDSVDQGSPAEQKVEVTYSGRSGWKIVDVRGASDALEVELTQTQRYSGRVAYRLLIRLKDSAAAGYFNDQLILVTNDEENPRIPMHLTGRVVPQISVSPESLPLGDVAQGQQVSRKVIVRGKKPFKILSVHCDDAEGFKFNTDDESKDRHVLEIVFDASKKQVGDYRETISIATDLGDKFRANLTALATVVPGAPPAAVEDAATTAVPPAGAAGSGGSTAGSAGAGTETAPGSVARQ